MVIREKGAHSLPLDDLESLNGWTDPSFPHSPVL